MGFLRKIIDALRRSSDEGIGALGRSSDEAWDIPVSEAYEPNPNMEPLIYLDNEPVTLEEYAKATGTPLEEVRQQRGWYDWKNGEGLYGPKTAEDARAAEEAKKARLREERKAKLSSAWSTFSTGLRIGMLWNVLMLPLIVLVVLYRKREKIAALLDNARTSAPAV